MEKVPDEASPTPQNPSIYGDPEIVIAVVNNSVLANIREPDNKMLAKVDTKGLEESLLAGLDDSIKYNYKMFKTTLDRAYYAQHRDMPAYNYYSRIQDNEQTHLLVTLMKRDLCSEIMSDAQATLDNISHNHFVDNHEFRRLIKSTIILRNILGDKKLSALGFLSKIYFFAALSEGSEYRDTIGMQKLDSAIALEPNAVYLLIRGDVLIDKFHNEIAAIADFRKSMELSPTFFFPYYALSDIFKKKKQYDSALFYITKTLQLSVTRDDSSMGLYNLAEYYSLMNDKPEAIKYLAMSADYGFRYYGRIVFDSDLNNIKNTPEYETLMEKYFSFSLTVTYAKKNDKKKALRYFELTLKHEFQFLDSSSTSSRYTSQFSQNDLFRIIQQEPDANRRRERFVVAFYDRLHGDVDLDNIRSTREFKALMKKYFPDQHKE
jgi:tetratricopeptide (TPR) repeat protein